MGLAADAARQMAKEKAARSRLRNSIQRKEIVGQAAEAIRGLRKKRQDQAQEKSGGTSAGGAVVRALRRISGRLAPGAAEGAGASETTPLKQEAALAEPAAEPVPKANPAKEAPRAEPAAEPATKASQSTQQAPRAEPAAEPAPKASQPTQQAPLPPAEPARPTAALAEAPVQPAAPPQSEPPISVRWVPPPPQPVAPARPVPLPEPCSLREAMTLADPSPDKDCPPAPPRTAGTPMRSPQSPQSPRIWADRMDLSDDVSHADALWLVNDLREEMAMAAALSGRPVLSNIFCCSVTSQNPNERHTRL